MGVKRQIGVVSELEFGPKTWLKHGVLTIDRDALADELRLHEPRIANLAIHLARPGESTRILCTKDVIQPAFKPDGVEPGEGVTHALEKLAVVTCGPIVGFQEGVIDMSGPGAAYTPFSSLFLLIVELDVVAGTKPHAHEEAVRQTGLRAAQLIAEKTVESPHDRVDEIHWSPLPDSVGLPRIVYIDMVLSQGLLHDTWVLGCNASEGLPRVLDPCVIVDGGVVSGNCVSACDKTTTFHHQNNPVISKLLAGHGKRWNFAGVILTNEPTRLSEKQRSAARAVELARELGADGAVITKEGFGNPDADLMMIVRGLESGGIATVAVSDEFAGVDGGSQSLADTAPEAAAVISVGNANERLVLPPMQNVIGPVPDVARLAGGYAQSVRTDGSMELELQAIVGATNQLGYGHLSCRTV